MVEQPGQRHTALVAADSLACGLHLLGTLVQHGYPQVLAEHLHLRLQPAGRPWISDRWPRASWRLPLSPGVAVQIGAAENEALAAVERVEESASVLP